MILIFKLVTLPIKWALILVAAVCVAPWYFMAIICKLAVGTAVVRFMIGGERD